MKKAILGKIMMAVLGAVVVTECIVFGGLGLGVVASVIVLYAGFYSLYRQEGHDRFFRRWECIPISAVLLCFVLYDNTLLKLLNGVLLIFLIHMHMNSVFKGTLHEVFTPKWFVEILASVSIHPLRRQKQVIAEQRSLVSSIAPGQTVQIKKIILGLCLALPMVLVVALLLMGADAAFQDMMYHLGDVFTYDYFTIIQHIVVSIGVYMVLLGSYHYYQNPRLEGSKDDVSEESVEKRYWDFTIVMTVIVAIAGVYVLYVCSQLQYFVAAFSGNLPEEYTYAMYARRGFFELVPIIIINLILILMIHFKLEQSTTRRVSCIRGMSSFYIVFTLFLISTALAKMVMYMQLYGLTLKRVYVAWFLGLCFIELVWVLIKLYKAQLRLFRALFMTFLVLYIGLNYINVDYLVAKWNTSDYISDGISGVGELRELSLSAVGPLVESKEWGTLAYKDYQRRCEINRDWRSWNLAYQWGKERYEQWEQEKK